MQQVETSSDATELPRHEEIVNTITHGFGLVLSILGSVAIMASAPSIQMGLAIGCGVYAISLVTVYAVSTLSHLVQRRETKYLFQAWDQGVIYLLIAGTYTPFACLYLTSYTRWIVLGGIWTTALLGFFSKVVLKYRVQAFKPHSYVLLGWIPALTMLHLVSLACLIWMIVGGLMYTIGTIFLALDRRFSFFHATWHMFVVAGSACHFYAITAFLVFA